MSKTHKTILILYASTGSGHKTAAESIAKAMKDVCKYEISDMQFSKSEIKVIDILDFFITDFDGNKAATTYTGLLAPFHDVTWRYNFTGRLVWGGCSIIGKFLFKKFLDFIKNNSPDIVICTHMIAANAAAGARMSTKIKFPIISVPTDYETEGMWPHKSTDLFCVATESMIETLESRRVLDDKILLTGIPVAPDFSKNIDKRAAREILHLPQDKQIALIIAGASEPMPYINLRKALNHVIKYFAQMDWMHFIFCVGKDEEYKRYLLSKIETYSATNIEVVGYTDQMAKLMFASDIALCKAGGLTVTECICAELPMLLIGKSYAQEHINLRYLTSVGVAQHATTYKQLISLLCRITSNETIYKAMLTNLRFIRKENAAFDIAKASLEVGGCKGVDSKAKHARILYSLRRDQSSLLGLYIGKAPAHAR